MQTRITELLDIKYPIPKVVWPGSQMVTWLVLFQRLVVLRIIGGEMRLRKVKANIDKIKSLTDRPFGVQYHALSPL